MSILDSINNVITSLGTASKFDISAFRSQLDNFGGIARPSLFRVLITVPSFMSGIVTTQNLSFFCQATTLPGVRIASKPVQRYGIGPLEKMPVGFEFDDLALNFIADANGNILNFFKDWSRSIVEYSSEGVPSSVPSNANKGMSGALPYYVNYKQQYQTQIDIITYAPTSQQGYSVSLLGAFPVDIGDVVLNWGQQDSLMLVPIRFSFIDMAWSGSSTNNGFFATPSSLVNSINSTVATINNTISAISNIF